MAEANSTIPESPVPAVPRRSRRRGRLLTRGAPSMEPPRLAAASRPSSPPPRMTRPKQAPTTSRRAIDREEYLLPGSPEDAGLVQGVVGMSLGECGNELRFEDEMKFMENIDPEMSEREQKKQNKKISKAPERSTVYDEKGIHVKLGLDLCDCLTVECEGCFFPCPKCRSPKCGNVCRVNRDWMIEEYEIQGMDEIVRNPFLNHYD